MPTERFEGRSHLCNNVMKGILRKRATLAALQLFAAQNREPKRLGLAHGVRAAVPSARDCGRNALGENFSCLFLGGSRLSFCVLNFYYKSMMSEV